MKVTGKLIKLLPVESGVSQNGKAWTRGGLVIEYSVQGYNGDYTYQLALQAFGQPKCDNIATIPVGTMVEVAFSPTSREYQGRYYTQCDLVGIMPILPQTAPTSQQPASQPSGWPTTPQPQMPPSTRKPAPTQTPQEDNDLPF